MENQLKMNNIIDLTYLRETTEDNLEIMIELIEIFLEQYPESNNKVINAFTNMNITALSEAAHSLKSSLRIVGIIDIAEKMAILENYCRKNTNHSEFKELVDYYRNNIDKFIIQLEKQLDDFKAQLVVSGQ